MMRQVSVILPYFEGQRWLLKAIRSVQAQRGVSWELVVVDDGSVRSPESILDSLSDNRIRLIRKTHGGKGSALNMGVKAAKADIIGFLDQDDTMVTGRLRKQLDAFARNPHTDLVYSDYERVFEDGTLIDQFVSHQASCRECLHKMAEGAALISMQNMLIQKSVVIRVGGFSEDLDLTGLDDAEFFARLFASEAIVKYEPGVVHQWVQHGKNYSRGLEFQEARLILLNHLSNLAQQYPIIQKELPCFRFHAFYMRGLYFLENQMPKKSMTEFCRAISVRPFSWNSYYLLFKSLIHQLGRP